MVTKTLCRSLVQVNRRRPHHSELFVLPCRNGFLEIPELKQSFTMPSPPSKRVKLDPDAADPTSIRSKRAAFLNSISRSISPPAVSRHGTPTSANPKKPQSLTAEEETVFQAKSPRDESNGPTTSGRRANHASQPASKPTATLSSKGAPPNGHAARLIASPFRLTSIRDLPSSQNIDTISLHDILGIPLIKEAWIFNYCFDVDWLMSYFDEDIRSQVKVKVVHGSWRAEDGNRLGIEDACRRWPNVESVTAYMPDAFGTHHSKMFILFTHDDLAQVVIHTANMLHRDWTNMTQAVWQSPMLPVLPPTTNNNSTGAKGNQPKSTSTSPIGSIGTGSRFKHDMMAYLSAYGTKTKSLREQLVRFDFSSVRGALVASVPSRMKEPTVFSSQSLGNTTLWGYPSLFRTLETICPSLAIEQGQTPHQSNIKSRTIATHSTSMSTPTSTFTITTPTSTFNLQHQQNNTPRSHPDIDSISTTTSQTKPSGKPHPHVVCQISSIATLPASWLNQFFSGIVGGGHSHENKPYPLPPATASTSANTKTNTRKQSPKSPSVKFDPSTISIIFPTPQNVASSLDGYASGGSIHMKAQAASHLNQISLLRPSLCQWTRSQTGASSSSSLSGRHLAAPHVKTYIRFKSKPTTQHPTPDIDWALLTSANLSTQAWGVVREPKDKRKEKEVVVQSFEIGVLVWPGLFGPEFEDEGTIKQDGAGSGRDARMGTGDYDIKNTTNPSKEDQSQNLNSVHSVRMAPVFGTDMPSQLQLQPANIGTGIVEDGTASGNGNENGNVNEKDVSSTTTTLVGIRLPYDLPLTPYVETDMPWSPQGVYEVPDRHGRRWPRDFS
ncbi:hypothetical protein HRR80_006189 [Exophiala dermatitidis]|nr:hypothetical protein HRR77_007726 [Exophiala dermatitidis]KAJ4544642.1 hypothetical protein HRR76_002694 [Exophiala dermatitidis]KAJ4554604.1 hypothetical protein HRR79_009457 [Exophiala dermatitidis]KAJ8990056.1 hypothetical protein HRR80_006189 [Exophiala dermatitidis]